MKKPIIEVCTRLMDCWYIYGKEQSYRMPKYHAQIKGKSHWSCGRTVEEAVEDLMRCHKEMFPSGYDKIIYLAGPLPR